MNPAIVVVGYDRLETLKRLLKSLLSANYPDSPVTLVLCVDGGAPSAEVAAFASKFNWPFGPMRVIHQTQNLGLRAHILACGDLSEEYGAIILLEDDLLVSPDFYNYVLARLPEVAKYPQAAGLSLYRHRVNFLNRWPFEPELVGQDGLLMKIPSSWGQAWTKDMWFGFRSWLSVVLVEGVPTAGVPPTVRNWPESSWVKLFTAYLNAQDKYFYYPEGAYSTNCGDPGHHAKSFRRMFATPLTARFRPHPLDPESLVTYDSYFEIEPSALRELQPRLANYQFSVDLWGLKPASELSEPFVLGLSDSPGVVCFGMNLRPLESNVFYGVSGSGIALVPRDEYLRNRRVSPAQQREIHERRIGGRELLRLVLDHFLTRT